MLITLYHNEQIENLKNETNKGPAKLPVSTNNVAHAAYQLARKLFSIFYAGDFIIPFFINNNEAQAGILHSVWIYITLYFWRTFHLYARFIAI